MSGWPASESQCFCHLRRARVHQHSGRSDRNGQVVTGRTDTTKDVFRTVDLVDVDPVVSDRVPAQERTQG